MHVSLFLISSDYIIFIIKKYIESESPLIILYTIFHFILSSMKQIEFRIRAKRYIISKGNKLVDNFNFLINKSKKSRSFNRTGVATM